MSFRVFLGHLLNFKDPFLFRVLLKSCAGLTTSVEYNDLAESLLGFQLGIEREGIFQTLMQVRLLCLTNKNTLAALIWADIC